MLKTETQPVKRLWETPDVKPPRRLPVGAEVLRGGASIFGYGPHNAARWTWSSKGDPGRGPARSHGS